MAGSNICTTLSMAPRRDEKVKVLRATRPIHKDEVVLGQYTAGNGMAGYLEDKVFLNYSQAPSNWQHPDGRTPPATSTVEGYEEDKVGLHPPKYATAHSASSCAEDRAGILIVRKHASPPR